MISDQNLIRCPYDTPMTEKEMEDERKRQYIRKNPCPDVTPVLVDVYVAQQAGVNVTPTPQETKLIAHQQQSTSPVVEHASFFADQKGMLTCPFMAARHHELGVKPGLGLTVKLKAITNMLSDRKLEPSFKNIAKIENPAATGIWNKDGTVNLERLNMACQKAIPLPNGTRILLRKHLNEFLQDVHQNKTDFGNATHVGYILPVPWATVTSKSIDEMFTYGWDYKYTNEEGKQENALTVDWFREFYLKPRNFLEVVRARKLEAGTNDDVKPDEELNF